MVIEAYKDSCFAEVVNAADLITPDGMPIAKSILALYGIPQDRVAGMDLLEDVFDVAQRNGFRVFIYGSTRIVLDLALKRISELYPKLIICGVHSPPFRDLTHQEEIDVCDILERSTPDIILVALGCPKQEFWMGKNKGRIPAVMIGIGGALPVFAGVQSRAPVFMQRLSLEWLFRLFQEPKRLFKRYLVTNTCFIRLITKEYFLGRK
jgi:N-acetylglucosaminyldiphosphoundecaprenol N-acetyl-beta-D-mannosaminyltransferase